MEATHRLTFTVTLDIAEGAGDPELMARCFRAYIEDHESPFWADYGEDGENLAGWRGPYVTNARVVRDDTVEVSQ